jgi:hypothetical protein
MNRIKKPIKLGALAAVILSALVLNACQHPAGPTPQTETKNITLTLSAPGMRDVSLPFVLTGGAANSATIVWKPEFQNKAITITKSGDNSTFMTSGTSLSMGVDPDPAGTKISTADKSSLVAELEKVKSRLEAMGVSISYSIGVSEVPSYGNPTAETRNITITISRDGVPLPAIPVTLVEGEDKSGAFQWRDEYQNAAGFSVSVGGNTTPFTAGNGAAFTLSITGDSDGVKMSDADWGKLDTAIDAGLTAIASMNVTASKNIDPTVDRVSSYAPDPGNDISLAPGVSGAWTAPGEITISDFTDPGAAVNFVVAADPARLDGSPITVKLTHADGAPRLVSLATVYNMREALKTAGAGEITVSAPDDKFTPVYNSREWLTINIINSNQAVKNLYASYSSIPPAGIEIMDGIKVVEHPDDNKSVIVYSRAIKVDEVAVGVDNGNGHSISYPFLGLGLKKEGSGSIFPVGSDPILIHGGVIDEYQVLIMVCILILPRIKLF